jgi:tetratricopeptide (TPR) repeat protein
MARLTVRTTFDACHGTRDVRDATFVVEVMVQGPILGDFVAGVDDVVVGRRLHSEVDALRGKLLDDVFGRATLENVAAFFIASLTDIAVAAVCVETGLSKATVFAHEIDLQTWPAELAFRRGVSRQLRGREVSALAEFSRAIDLAPRWAAAYNARGRCFRCLADKESALSDFDRALVLDPKFGEAHRNKGNILLESGRAIEALQSFDRAVELLPESALAYNNRGFALQQAGEYERAVPDHQEAIRLDPSYAEAFRDLGDALDQLGRVTEARSARDEASRLEPLVDRLANERAKLVHVPCSPKLLAGAPERMTTRVP